jgi:ethanolamine utilization protein EutM
VSFFRQPNGSKLSPVSTTTDGLQSLALLEVGHLTAALLVADHCCKAAGVRIIGIESADPAQCIKLAGSPADVAEAGRVGLELARRMGTTAELVVMAAPCEVTKQLADQPPIYSPLLDIYDSRVPLQASENATMSTKSETEGGAIGLLETQGLVAALHATDEMLKSAAVVLVGKEKIGAAYVTIIVRGDVAAVQSAIDSGRQTVERLGGKLIMADVIARPHPDLAALLPK